MTTTVTQHGLLGVVVDVWASLPAEVLDDVVPPQSSTERSEQASGFGEASRSRCRLA